MSKLSSVRPQDIRNIVLLGHGGAGKTTLAEAILFKTGAITRMGSVTEGNTVADFEPEAKAHQHSTNSSLVYATYQGKVVNVVDTPGHPDFAGFALAMLPGVEVAVIVVNATTGVEFNTRRMFEAAGKMALARMFVINKIDVDPGKLAQVVSDLKAAFGNHLHCLNLPTKGGSDVIDCFEKEAGDSDFGSVADTHQELVESTVEVDDDQMNRYLSGEKIEGAELKQAFIKALVSGHMMPILFTSSVKQVGIDALLRTLVDVAPSPTTGTVKTVKKGDQEITVACDPDKPFVGQVLKVTSDPYLGQLATIRILQGKLEGSSLFLCGTDKKAKKAGHVLKGLGKEHPEVDGAAYAGDLVSLAKIEDIHVHQIIHDQAAPQDWEAVLPAFPKPMSSLTIIAKNRNDEVKLSQSLIRLKEEDPTFKAEHDHGTNELVVSCLGDVHLRVTLEKLKNRFNVEVSSKPPSVAYRETITGKAEGHHRHKKQTGGAGQFGEVFLRIEPRARGAGLEIENAVVGGAIPTQYIASVEKGINDAVSAGILAGFPVMDVKVTIYDGKSHPVDSKDIAFRTAGKYAVRDAMEKAKPVLLEPIVSMEIVAPEQYTGDITGHLKQHRGRVMGMDSGPGGMSVVNAQAPLAELGNFSAQLRSVTAGQGSYTMELAHYDIVPPNVQQKVSAERKAAMGKEPEE